MTMMRDTIDKILCPEKGTEDVLWATMTPPGLEGQSSPTCLTLGLDSGVFMACEQVSLPANCA